MERTQRNLVYASRATWLGAGPVHWLFDSKAAPDNRLAVRWIFLRLLAAIYFSAFFPLLFQIEGLNGPNGVLPTQRFLLAVQGEMGSLRYWYAPTLFWLSSGSHMMLAVIWLGLAASAAALFNLWLRLSFFICFVCFPVICHRGAGIFKLSVRQHVAGSGLPGSICCALRNHAGLGNRELTSRASLFLLQREWVPHRSFESGIVKLLMAI